MAELLIKFWVTLLSLVVVMAIGLGCSALWSAATAFQAGELAFYDLGVALKCHVVITLSRILMVLTPMAVGGYLEAYWRWVEGWR